MTAPIRYARDGGVNIAYQVVGEGDVDLVWVQGWVSHLELMWEQPEYASFLRRLSRFSRLILLDKRGTGLSDRVSPEALPTLEERMDDVRAVMDAAGSERAALFGVSEGGPMCALFAATYPQRTVALIMYAGYARFLIELPEYPWGWPPEGMEGLIQQLEDTWGANRELLRIWAPTKADDPVAVDWFNRYLRMSASPATASALSRMNVGIDIRGVLPVIRVPTLLLQRSGDRLVDVGHGRYLASRISGARLVELEDDNHVWFWGDPEPILDEVEEFLTGVRPAPLHDRVLATVLVTDLVGSTERAISLGDAGWAALVELHDDAVRRELVRFSGEEIDTAGDGFLALFDGPARAIRCALAIREVLRPLGLEVRAGVHTGEVERHSGEKPRGIAVHIGARLASLAGRGEVFVSSTTTELVAGSGLEFEDRGEYELKGIEGARRLFAAA